MSDQQRTRRVFLGQSALALASSQALAQPASDKVVIGVMGLSRGKELCANFGKTKNVEIKYVCDVDSQRAGAAADIIEKNGAKRPDPIGDYRQMLDDKDLHALVCAAPNHWHGPATILGVQAGKHVYCEKPACHNPQEGEWMIQAARKADRAVQIGTQRRSSPTTAEGFQKLAEGVIGRVYSARCWYSNARGTIGKGEAVDPPPHLNYELWQGPAPRKPFISNRVHYNWHWFWHYGNGELGNNGVHVLDLCLWGLGAKFPTFVSSAGGRFAFQDDQETPDTQNVSYIFPDRKMVQWQGHSCNRYETDFVHFHGENGTLTIDAQGGYKIFDPKNKEIETVKGVRGDVEHVQNFVDAIRTGQHRKLNAEIEIAHRSTLVCHLGNIAQRTGRSLTCDGSNGHIQNDADAMKLWRRDYAPGWEPKV